MVLLALANVCVYALRYGILTWTPVYLSEVRHASLTGGIAGVVVFLIFNFALDLALPLGLLDFLEANDVRSRGRRWEFCCR